ncbi:MAG: nitroreductase [bacterium]
MLSRKVQWTLVFCAMLALAPLAARADVLPDYHHICLDMANGAFYDDSDIGPPDRACRPIAYEQYYHKFDGGGLNEVHITTDPAVPLGDVYVSDAQSGTFYVTDTGGKGYMDEVLLLVSVNAESLPPDFSLRIQSSGYVITTNSSQVVTSAEFDANALDQTFTADDFADYGYGPQSWKPEGSAGYPLWFGQNVSDPATSSLLLFIDLNVATVKEATLLPLDPDPQNKGAAKITYTFAGLPGLAAFNVYGFTFYSNAGQGISWTNKTADTGSSGLTVNPPPPDPGGWDVPDAQAATVPGADGQGSHAANVLFMILVPAGLVTISKVTVRLFRNR